MSLFDNSTILNHDIAGSIMVKHMNFMIILFSILPCLYTDIPGPHTVDSKLWPAISQVVSVHAYACDIFQFDNIQKFSYASLYVDAFQPTPQ